MTRVLLAGLAGGALHVARRVPRGGIQTACWRKIPAARIAQTRETRREVRLARAHDWICADCLDLVDLGRRRGRDAFLRATGW